MSMTWCCDFCRRVAITDGELPKGWDSAGVCPECKPAATTKEPK